MLGDEWVSGGDFIDRAAEETAQHPEPGSNRSGGFSRVALDGDTCRSRGEYYGSEEFEPYTADGEFWPAPAGAGIDELFDRWDTYDAEPIDPNSCEFAIQAPATSRRPLAHTLQLTRPAHPVAHSIYPQRRRPPASDTPPARRIAGPPNEERRAAPLFIPPACPVAIGAIPGLL